MCLFVSGCMNCHSEFGFFSMLQIEINTSRDRGILVA